MFIFGWTSPPTVMPGGGNWVGPCSAGIPFGFGSECQTSCRRADDLLTRSYSSGRAVFLCKRVHHRRVPGIRRVCARREDRHPFRARRCDPALHLRHVPQPRQRMGSVRLGLYLLRSREYSRSSVASVDKWLTFPWRRRLADPDSVLLLPVREGHPRQVEARGVRSRCPGRCRVGTIWTDGVSICFRARTTNISIIIVYVEPTMI